LDENDRKYGVCRTRDGYAAIRTIRTEERHDRLVVLFQTLSGADSWKAEKNGISGEATRRKEPEEMRKKTHTKVCETRV
jgi:hypothetical protein